MAAKIQQRNEEVDQQFVDLQKQLAADGFRSAVLKGQGVTASYDSFSLLRQSGDIDVWIDGGVETVVTLAESLGLKSDVTEQHVHLDIFENTEVEVHFIPSMLRCPFANARLQN